MTKSIKISHYSSNFFLQFSIYFLSKEEYLKVLFKHHLISYKLKPKYKNAKK